MVKQTKRPLVIGITGIIGSGKSTVGNILSEKGIPVIDTDKIVHELLANSDPARHAIIELFGPKIVTKNGAIDRAALAHIVFSHEDSRKQLEAIVHPAVVLECRKRIENQKGAQLIAVLVPLLFEAGLSKEYDEVWTVITSESILREHVMQREDLNQSLFEQRLAAQWPQEKKASLAKHVIDNSGTLEETKHQVELLLKHLICSQ